MRRYNLTANMYDARYRDEQQAKYKAALKELSLNPNCTILDVGCGSGLLLETIAWHIKTIVGIDISKELLLLAKKQAQKHDNINLVLADADYLPFKADFFDTLFAFTILQNMPNPVATLKELQFPACADACFIVTGLKAAVSAEKLDRILKKSNLRVLSIQEDEALRCRVVKAARNSS